MISPLSILYKRLTVKGEFLKCECAKFISCHRLNRTRSDKSFMALIAGHDKNSCHALRATCKINTHWNENELHSSSIQTVLYIGDKLFWNPNTHWMSRRQCHPNKPCNILSVSLLTLTFSHCFVIFIISWFYLRP